MPGDPQGRNDGRARNAPTIVIAAVAVALGSVLQRAWKTMRKNGKGEGEIPLHVQGA